MDGLREAGSEFAGYKVGKCVETGETGETYRAEQSASGARVLLWVLPATASGDVGYRDRFAQGMRAAATVNHPHLARVLASGEEDGNLWVAMEYVSGPTLESLIASYGRLDQSQMLSIADQIGSALDAIAAHGLAHGGVATARILVGTSGPQAGRAFLTGFGIPGPGPAVPRADVAGLGEVIARCLTGGSTEPDALPLAVEVVLAAADRTEFAACEPFASALRSAFAGSQVLATAPAPAPEPSSRPADIPPPPPPQPDIPRPAPAAEPVETQPTAVRSETVLSARPPAVIVPASPPAPNDPPRETRWTPVATVAIAVGAAAIVALLVVLIVR